MNARDSRARGHRRDAAVARLLFDFCELRSKHRLPRLSPAELSEARRASGNLGGRPRKPTQAEARAAALELLVPLAIKSWPLTWVMVILLRGEAGLRCSSSYGKPAEMVEDIPEDVDPFQVAAMSRAERAELVRRVLRAYPHLAELAPAIELVPDGPELDDRAG